MPSRYVAAICLPSGRKARANKTRLPRSMAFTDSPESTSQSSRKPYAEYEEAVTSCLPLGLKARSSNLG